MNMQRDFLFRFISIFLLFFFTIKSYSSNLPVKFEGSEHMTAGDKTKLFFSSEEGSTGHLLHLPNGLALTYGQLIALGDFYGLPKEPIALGKSEKERTTRFHAAFNTLAMTEQTVAETNQILQVFNFEKNEIEEGMKRGEKPEDIYKRIEKETTIKFNCITGGGCDSNWWMNPGRYLELQKTNFDHFGKNALLAYQAGHQLALEEAIEAHHIHDLNKLEIAYAMDGFAAHFLTDRFASGHMRTPRVELFSHVTPSVVGSILSGYMHGEDNENGLHVHNLNRDQWIAYGDRFYFNDCNKENIERMQQVLQISVNEIFYAYENGTMPYENEIAKLIPEPNEIKNNSHLDISSLFYWDEPSYKLYRRTNLDNYFDKHWTTNWWGWSTLLLLAKRHGLTIENQANLVLSGYGEIALRDGLLTDKDISNYVRYKVYKDN